jgi:hypothetical protein
VPVATEFLVDVEGVGALKVDVVVLRRRQVSGDLVCDLDAVGTQRVDRVAEIRGGPQHAGIGDQREAQRLVDLIIEEAARTWPRRAKKRSRGRLTGLIDFGLMGVRDPSVDLIPA